MKIKSIYKTGLFAALPIGCVAGLGILTAQAEEGAIDYTGSLGFGVGGAVGVDGNSAALQRRLGQNGNFYGGISDFGLETTLGDVRYTLEGSAMFGSGDYSFILNAEKDGLGYVELGYNEFRTWYDGSGGYLQGSTADWLPAFNDELHIDRGEVWVETGLRLEDVPEMTFRYTHAWRDGEKDSTSWGSNVSGAKLVPAYFGIHEKRDIFEFDVAHTLGNTDLALGLVYERIENDNDRVEYDSAAAVDDTVRDVYDADLFNAHTSSVTRLNDQMMLSFGYAFTTMNTDTDGSENTGNTSSQILGGADYKSHTFNTNFWWNPIEDLVLVPSVRAQWENTSAISKFMDGASDVGLTGDNDYQLISEQVEARYTGIDNLGLYAKILMTQESGDLDIYETNLGAPRTDRFMDSDKESWKAAIGGTYYARKNLSVAAEYYHKDSQSDYDAVVNYTSTAVHLGDYQIHELDTTVDDFNLRLTWRAQPNLTLVTRYDYQVVSYDAVGVSGGPVFTLKPEIEAGESDRNILSQSVTYLPTERLYVSGFVSYTWADTESAQSRGVPGVVSTSDNDYLTASLSTGYALDDKTTLTAGYSYYYAKNYSRLSDLTVMAYGTDMEEHVFSLGMNRRLAENMLLNVGYAYYTSNDGTSGGNNDFDAHMLSSGLQVTF